MVLFELPASDMVRRLYQEIVEYIKAVQVLPFGVKAMRYL
jgi:hypothetical protein